MLIKVAIIVMSCDLPARALVLNMKQFNGQHGCHLCEDEGCTTATNRLFRWWPYQSTSVLRTKESLAKNSVYATMTDKVVSMKCTLLYMILYMHKYTVYVNNSC